MSFFKKKTWLIFVLILVLTVGLAYISKSGSNPVSKVVNSVLTPIEDKISGITNPIKGFFDFCGNMKTLQKENEELKAHNLELEKKMKDISEYKSENERLEKLLNIKEDLTDYTSAAAKIVAYNPDNWFSYLTINKGEKSGIKVSDPVITSEGLIGQVSEVGTNWAKVSTIINSESSVGVRIIRNGEIGIVEGDTKLSKSNKCKLEYLSANASVIAGDILETSGLGGIYPPGLMVGKITDISKDNMGRLDCAIIEPFIDFDNLREVLVLTTWTTESEKNDTSVNPTEVSISERED